MNWETSEIKVDYSVKDLNTLFSAYLAAASEEGLITSKEGFLCKGIFNSMMNDIVFYREACDDTLATLRSIEQTETDGIDVLKQESWDIVKAAENVAKKAVEDMN